MQRITGFDKAIEILRPHWQEFNEHFENENQKFKQLLRADYTVLGRIMKCHLISEVYIDNYLSEKLAISNLSDVRLSYYQKAQLLPEHGLPPALIKPGILKLHSIRNRFAHNLSSNVSSDELASMTNVMRIARPEVDGLGPTSIIESFTTLACTFLLVTPPHLEEVFARAFRDVAVDPEGDQE